ncbi:hypothetical protein NSE01_37050 [Novosphingobium sediminis]|uniref:Uncharacterized protein n=1 Tax=Novosphingobium sediminis TaxID=707214 RepID=A0A512AQ93_9SPHN|nr:hypothetical protein [Novosphingobium sediminis]GEO01873.1 hypothetical protein NSE01_37050 [Novosphingobium sediminis]
MTTVSLSYIATLQHAQWMLAADGQYLELIGKQRSVSAAQRMFREYNVARTIWGKDGLKNFAETVFDKAAKVPWPATLTDRADWCATLAETAYRPTGKNGQPQGSAYSAATKLAWFINPDGWTMFDKFAGIGLGASDIRSFYRELDGLGFAGEAQKLNACIATHGFTGIYGERIIDKFLMSRGMLWDAKLQDQGTERASLLAQAERFLANLAGIHSAGDTLAKRLRDLATDISKILTNDAFLAPAALKKMTKRGV